MLHHKISQPSVRLHTVIAFDYTLICFIECLSFRKTPTAKQVMPGTLVDALVELHSSLQRVLLKPFNKRA